MADPVVVTCLKNVWTKVATNVTAGRVHRLNDTPAKYVQTYRLTGYVAPTDNQDAAVLFRDSTSEPISASVAIDVYVQAINEDGEVRVDL